ncbi:MAG: methionine--tRNA ligase subunit beta [Candidatus Pacebacteria bacterium]|nr:methionine--tRNA ligase subunit beta [Candidatus Paceibacterota bacterium]PIR59933.1 MAG: methionine--tRNA ligase subunit beta [Candidatus Pacebacteria bacterium CG10_big_fil_rev_8_21_14_0_10_44_54]
MSNAKVPINYDVFASLDLRIATITAVELVEGADKLLKLTLDVGDLGERIVVAGIKAWYAPEDLLGKQVSYLANLEPRKLRGIESQGMLIAADDGTRAVLLHPDQSLSAGSVLR